MKTITSGALIEVDKSQKLAYFNILGKIRIGRIMMMEAKREKIANAFASGSKRYSEAAAALRNGDPSLAIRVLATDRVQVVSRLNMIVNDGSEPTPEWSELGARVDTIDACLRVLEQ